MTYTTNYNLKKPEATDPVNVDDLNDNADTIDTALAAKQDTLTAGTGIDITGNVISATGGGGGGGSRLPSAYQEVEYIESTGTQYIDTGVKVKQTTRIILEEAQTQLSSFSLQGISDANSSFAVITWGITSRLQYFESRVGTTNTSWAYTNVPIDTQYHKYDMSNGSQKIDNNQYGTSTIPNGYESYRNILLFARYSNAHNVSTPDEFAKVRTKANQIYEGDTLVRDYIPVYNIFTGEAGLFDKVESKFYGNQGTGAFIKGNDVN